MSNSRPVGPHRTAAYMAMAGMLLLTTACGGPRKACRKAERHIARAVYMCPEVLEARVRRDTVTITLPGAVDSGSAALDSVNVDSLMAACAQLAEALAAERDLYAAAVAQRPTEVVRTIQRQLCQFATITVADTNLLLKIWAEDGQVRYWYNVLPQQVQVPVVTQETVVNPGNNCPPPGVAPWYRTFFWLLMALLLISFLWAIRRKFTRWPL